MNYRGEELPMLQKEEDMHLTPVIEEDISAFSLLRNRIRLGFSLLRNRITPPSAIEEYRNTPPSAFLLLRITPISPSAIEEYISPSAIEEYRSRSAIEEYRNRITPAIEEYRNRITPPSAFLLLRNRIRIPSALSEIVIQEDFRSSKYCASECASSRYNGSGGYGTSGDPTIARMQKMRVLKQYDWIKEKLYWRDIISITDNLYSDGHLKHHELDKIQDRYQPRRKAADNLLKIVLRNPSAISAFMRILESKSHLFYIAERINMTKISAAGPDNSLSQTHMKTSLAKQGSASGAVEKMVSSLRMATVRQKLNSLARKNLDLEFKEAVKGSSGITFVFSVVEPTQKLKHPFATGPDIFAERMFQSYCDLDDQEPQQFEM